jgi:hypothetical protein
VIASIDESANGRASAVPATASAPGVVAARNSRMPATGSTAITVAPDGASRRVSLPVPAATSATVAGAVMRSASASHATASSGYEGRARSYAAASAPKPLLATS